MGLYSFCVQQAGMGLKIGRPKMLTMKISCFVLLFTCFFIACDMDHEPEEMLRLQDLMIRIAELEIEPDYLEEYIAILKEEAAASVRLEPGVICIFPMYQKENPTEIRLLEVYANREAYEAHLQTPHFKHYKTTTLNMVKSLKLIDMEAIDAETMSAIFTKLM